MKSVRRTLVRHRTCFGFVSSCFHMKMSCQMFYIVAFRIDASRHDPCVAPLTCLILPVVICLSQRLSHACLSINFCMVTLRAHQNSKSLFDSIHKMDTSGNSGAHTCIQTRLMQCCVYYIPNLPTSVVFLMIHDKILIAFGDESFMFLPNQHSMVG